LIKLAGKVSEVLAVGSSTFPSFKPELGAKLLLGSREPV
jgi:hypothetical protein